MYFILFWDASTFLCFSKHPNFSTGVWRDLPTGRHGLQSSGASIPNPTVDGSEIPNNHRLDGTTKTLQIKGSTTNLNWLAGFQPSTVSSPVLIYRRIWMTNILNGAKRNRYTSETTKCLTWCPRRCTLGPSTHEQWYTAYNSIQSIANSEFQLFDFNQAKHSKTRHL